MSGILLGQFNGVLSRDTQVVTVGQDVFCDKYACGTTGWGYSASAGAIYDGTFNLISNTPISLLQYITNYFGPEGMYFSLNAAVANSGWTSMTVGSDVYLRTAATFSSGSGYSTWYWGTTTNSFGTTVGATVTVNFV